MEYIVFDKRQIRHTKQLHKLNVIVTKCLDRIKSSRTQSVNQITYRIEFSIQLVIDFN